MWPKANLVRPVTSPPRLSPQAQVKVASPEARGGFRVAPPVSRRQFRAASFAPPVVNPGRLMPGVATVELPIRSVSLGFIGFLALQDSQMPWHIAHEVSTADGFAPPVSRRQFRAENSKPSPECRVQSAEYRVQSTECRVQSTERGVQSAARRVQSTS